MNGAPMKKRNRRKLRLRAARWKAQKAGTYEDAILRRLTGQGYASFMGKGQAPVKGLLT